MSTPSATAPVTLTPGKSNIHWLRPDEEFPLALTSIFSAEGLTPEVIFFGGGNAGLSDEIKAKMPEYFGSVWAGVSGVVASGGTGKFDADGKEKSFEITTVTALLKSQNKCAAIGFTPVTAQPSIAHNGFGITIGGYGTMLDPRQDANAIIAAKPSDTFLGWNGDLAKRFALIEDLLEHGKKVSYVIFNGGAVTAEEIYQAMALTKKGLVLFIVAGSGREADKAIANIDKGTIDPSGCPGDDDAAKAAIAAVRQGILDTAEKTNIVIIPFDDADASRQAVIDRGFIPSATGCAGGCSCSTEG